MNCGKRALTIFKDFGWRCSCNRLRCCGSFNNWTMGAHFTTENDPTDVERMREAENALWETYGVHNRISEHQLTLSKANWHLEGVQRARVWILGPQDGIPVVFVHGGGGTPGDFAQLLPFLSQSSSTGHKKYRIILVERPGNGLSESFDYTYCELDTFAAHFLREILHALKIPKAHLVGSSLGGASVVWFAQQFPEQVSSVCIVGVPACFQGMHLPFYFWFVSSLFGLILVNLPVFRWIPLILLWIFFRIPYNSIPSAYIDCAFRAMAIRNNMLSIQTMFGRMFVYCDSNANKGWRLEDLQQLREQFPVMFLDGPEDPFMTQAQREQVTKYLGKNRHIKIGNGHMPWFSNPKGIARELEDFWNE
jgi:pimeloyl-ACP methyl ester carboxylesterase